ncbi:Golgi resident protein GCP60-like [Agrilus planipennis]|nr:Golgi resident protein GCP60-like [Agrilus planipennis]
MAAVGDNTSSVAEKFKHLSIENKTGFGAAENDQINILSNNSLPLQEVYKLALNFYKEKEGKAVHLSYEDKLQLVAFSQQVSHGPLSEAVSKLPPLGALDVVGRDRRLAWQKLGNLDADQARRGFVELLYRRCPLFNAYTEAHRCEKEEQERLIEEERKRRLLEEEERKKLEAEEKLKREQLEKEELIKQQIKQALNQQTYEQFRNYAEQQFPGDPEKQGTLIKQLQEQHYIQYMQQLQAVHRDEEIILKGTDNEVNANEEKTQTTEQSSDDLNNGSPPALSSLSETLVPANMWTRSDIQAFKQAVSQAEGDGVVRVGHGETVTVRVPTHKDGSRIFWEFATDHYDIG